MTSERHGRPVFYGAMITEGIVALIWAAAATYFFHENGMGETNAAVVVDAITKDWLGTVGGFLAILGVIAAPITSGDTAFRSARLIVADFLGMEQKIHASSFVYMYSYVSRCYRFVALQFERQRGF